MPFFTYDIMVSTEAIHGHGHQSEPLSKILCSWHLFPSVSTVLLDTALGQQSVLASPTIYGVSRLCEVLWAVSPLLMCVLLILFQRLGKMT